MSAQNSNVDFVVVDETGRIQYWGNMPEFMLAVQEPAPPLVLVLGYGKPDTNYVKDGVIVEREANPSTLDGMKISNVPNPSTVTIGTEPATDIQDGEVDLEFAYPGTYTVVVSSWPYLDATFTVTQQ